MSEKKWFEKFFIYEVFGFLSTIVLACSIFLLPAVVPVGVGGVAVFSAGVGVVSWGVVVLAAVVGGVGRERGNCEM